MNLKGKKVLVVGLGTLGGGVATVKWLTKQGAALTVTDLRSAEKLRDSLKALGIKKTTAFEHKGHESSVVIHRGTAGKIRFVLGCHRVKDFEEADCVVVGPGVKIIGNTFIAAAKKKRIPIVNDLLLFLERIKNPLVTVTGTRGKTTTTNWIAHFLEAKYKGIRASGNSSKDALLKLLPRLERNKNIPAVVELSSFQLEALDFTQDNATALSVRGPDVAIITNLLRDHMNRHETMRNYAIAKANIFRYQKRNQKLILNLDNPWTKFFLAKNPRAGIYYISRKTIPAGRSGFEMLLRKIRRGVTHGEKGLLCYRAAPAREIVFVRRGKIERAFSSETARKIEALGEHNAYNFLAASLAAHLAGVSWKEMERDVKRLPQIPLRQEVIIEEKNFTVVNDSAGTSPEATIAAIRRFAREGEIALVTGGTDKGLEFKALAREIEKNISPEDLFLLNGSATKKLLRELEGIGYFKKTKPHVFEDLKKLLLAAKLQLQTVGCQSPTTLLFSPGSASFEKFKNEFDRGAKFNAYSRAVFRK